MTFLIISLTCLIARVFGQSNYAQHGNNINYIGTGLPEETLLDGKVSRQRVSRLFGHFEWANIFLQLIVEYLNFFSLHNWSDLSRIILNSFFLIDNDTFHFTPISTLFLGNETRWLKPDYFLKSNEGRVKLRCWIHGGEFSFSIPIHRHSTYRRKKIISKVLSSREFWCSCTQCYERFEIDCLLIQSQLKVVMCKKTAALCFWKNQINLIKPLTIPLCV